MCEIGKLFGWQRRVRSVSLTPSPLFSLPSVPLPFGPSSQPSDQESILTSRQLLEHYAGSDRLHMPLGHTVMVANSKNDFYARLNAAGQPIMDQLAKTMVEEILK